MVPFYFCQYSRLPCTLSIRRQSAENIGIMLAALPETEAVRLQILRDYDILDTLPEIEFDDFTLLAAQICGTPIALISLIDEERQWFKSRLGLDVPETCRDAAFCAHALHHTEVFLVPDAQKDPRFYDNPLVTSEPFIRFYAGAPLLTAGGHALGTLCVIDREPRTLSVAQQNALQALARQIIARLELRRGIASRVRAEQKLRESETLKSAILHSALDCIIIINAAGQVVEWNPAAERTFGYRAAEAMGRELTALIVPEAYREAHRRGMTHYLATGEGPVLGQRIEITALRANGSELPVELAITPLRLPSGLHFTATLRDITARKEAEEALRRAHEQMEARVEERTRELDGVRRHNESLLLAAGKGIFGLDAQGCTTFVNPAAARMLGWPEADLLGRPMHALLHHSRSNGSPFPACECSIDAVLHGAEGQQVDDEVFWRKDGTAFPVEYIARPLLEENQVGGAVVTFQDVSARREGAEALRRSEVRYQRIAANVPGMIFQFIFQPDGSIDFPYVSDGCRAIYGVAPKEIVADPGHLMDIIHPEDRPKFDQSIQAIRTNASFWQWEGRVITRTGRTVWVQGVARAERQVDGSILGEGLILRSV